MYYVVNVLVWIPTIKKGTSSDPFMPHVLAEQPLKQSNNTVWVTTVAQMVWITGLRAKHSHSSQQLCNRKDKEIQKAYLHPKVNPFTITFYCLS